MIQNNNINNIYRELLEKLNDIEFEVNPRGLSCKELIGVKIVLTDINNNVISIPGVKTNLNYVKKELDWYYSGNPRIVDDELLNRVWKCFSDDGVRVNSNYGERIFGKHPIISLNQWDWVKKKLLSDRDSRQAIINLNSYFDKYEETKDFVCTVSMQFLIRDGKLHLIVYMRSNDVYYGFRNDVYCFTEMQKRMANELNVDYGSYYHFAGSLHLYETEYLKVLEALK